MKSQQLARDLPGSPSPTVDHDQDASTRQRVVRTILQCGPSSATELADRLGLTAAGVRRHLDVLTERGQVEPRERRVYGARGRGRPAKVFALTDTGRADLYQAYDTLAIQALEVLAEQAGPDGLAALGRRRLGPVEQGYDRRRSSEPRSDRGPAQALADALSDEGYVASVRPAGAGEQLCQHHCPVAHVAERFPQLCETETELFSKLLGVHVQRLATIAHGDGVCTTHIPPHVPESQPTQGRQSI